MKPIPIPPCNNNRRTHMKCRRMCCKRPKPVEPKTHQKQLQFWSYDAQIQFDHLGNGK